MTAHRDPGGMATLPASGYITIPAALRPFALTGLTPASRSYLPPPSPAESQADLKARLFGLIRDDAARHHAHRRMVRQALTDPAGPPPRKRGTRPAPAIGPIQDVLDKLAAQPLTVWEIWTTVTDRHDSDA